MRRPVSSGHLPGPGEALTSPGEEACSWDLPLPPCVSQKPSAGPREGVKGPPQHCPLRPRSPPTSPPPSQSPGSFAARRQRHPQAGFFCGDGGAAPAREGGALGPPSRLVPSPSLPLPAQPAPPREGGGKQGRRPGGRRGKSLLAWREKLAEGGGTVVALPSLIRPGVGPPVSPGDPTCPG